MSGPIVFISRSRIVAGKGKELAAMSGRAVELIGSSKPRTALFAAYTDAAGGEVRIVHAFPDGEAMMLHFGGSEERTQSAAAAISLAGFEVYGEAPSSALEQLGREAEDAEIPLLIFGSTLGGFLRPPA